MMRISTSRSTPRIVFVVVLVVIEDVVVVVVVVLVIVLVLVVGRLLVVVVVVVLLFPFQTGANANCLNAPVGRTSLPAVPSPPRGLAQPCLHCQETCKRALNTG